MKRCIFCIAILTFSVLSAGDEPSNEPNENSQSQESSDNSSSTADKVIEAIADAAVNDRDFEKISAIDKQDFF